MEPLRAADGEGGRAARRGDGGWHAREGAGHEAALAGGAACKGQEDVWRCARRRQKQEGGLGQGHSEQAGRGRQENAEAEDTFGVGAAGGDADQAGADEGHVYGPEHRRCCDKRCYLAMGARRPDRGKSLWVP